MNSLESVLTMGLDFSVGIAIDFISDIVGIVTIGDVIIGAGAGGIGTYDVEELDPHIRGGVNVVFTIPKLYTCWSDSGLIIKDSD